MPIYLCRGHTEDFDASFSALKLMRNKSEVLRPHAMPKLRRYQSVVWKIQS